jgi:hypothetical protein
MKRFQSVAQTSALAALVFVFRATPALHAQTIEWTRQIGTAADDISRAISADRLGNVYISGDTIGNLGGTNAGNADSFVSKYNSAAALLWTQQFGSSAYDSSTGVSADGLGSVYVVGNSDGATNCYIRKYNDAGVLQWSQLLPTHAPNGTPAVAADGLGGIYVTGNAQSASVPPDVFYNDAFVGKYDDSGNLLWTRPIASNGFDYGAGIAVDRLGNVFVAGSTDGNLAHTPQGSDAFVSKFDTAGNHQWTRQFGPSTEDLGLGVAADGFGNVFIGGRTFSSPGGYDGFVSKFDTAGALQWTRQVSTTAYDENPALWADQLGNIYTAGTTNGNLGASNNMGGDVFVRKYDPLGGLDWTNQILSRNFDAGLAITGDGLGSIYFSGYTAGDLAGTNSGGLDAFLIKLAAPIPEPRSAIQLIVGLCVSITWTRWFFGACHRELVSSASPARTLRLAAATTIVCLSC